MQEQQERNTHQSMDDTACLRKGKPSLARTFSTDRCSHFLQNILASFSSIFPRFFTSSSTRGYVPGNEGLLDAGKPHPVLRDTARQCVAISLSNRCDSTVSCGIPVSATLMIFHSVPTYRSSKVESYWLCIQSQIKYYTEIECRAFLICNYHKRFKAFIHFQVKEFLQ